MPLKKILIRIQVHYLISIILVNRVMMENEKKKKKGWACFLEWIV